MSLILFVIGISVYYYLYVSYSSKSEEPSKSNANANVTEIDYESYSLTPRQQFGSLFKNFVLKLFDPTNNNYFNTSNEKPNPFMFRAVVDRFKTLEDVTNAMKQAGLGHSRLILGIDFTASNEWQGRASLKGHSLHTLSSAKLNPYQKVINILQHVLHDFVDLSTPTTKTNSKVVDTGIPAFGFGCTFTQDHSTFSFRKDGKPCCDFNEVMSCYKTAVGERDLSGPTSYAPIIHKAIEIVEETNQYHILVILADGQFVTKEPTVQAIVAASYYSLSIVVVGLGDGPWDTLHQFDDWLPNRQFDNFQFVEYERIVKLTRNKNIEASLALHMLMEIPDQYKMVHKLGYISNVKTNSKQL